MYITKEEILQKVGSYEILNHYLLPHHSHGRLTEGKNISNPFLAKKQDTPSFNIFCALPQHEWMYKDFATDDKGDCFDLVMKLFNLDFPDALQKIAHDFGLEATNPIQSNKPQTQYSKSQVPMLEKPAFTVKEKPFTTDEIKYWNRFDITEAILQHFNVVSIEEYASKSKEGKPYTIKSSSENFIFGYKNGDAIKIYKPLDDKKYRFQFLGNKEPDYKFGWAQLPQNGEIVLITGGEKDVMTLAAHGFNAFTLNSESASLSHDIVKDLKEQFTKVVVLYDNDETGIKQTEKWVQEHHLYSISLPEMPDGKDISDFFALGNSFESFNKLIEGMQPLDNSHYQNSEMNSSNSNNQTGFANFANFADILEETEPLQDEILRTMPFLPDEVFDKLPSILKIGASVFEDFRERDVFLTGAFGVLSGCMSNVLGLYRGKEHYANLFTFVIAPAASGKGALSFSKNLGEKYHDRLVANSLEKQKLFQIEQQVYKRKIADKKANLEEIEQPVEPNFRVLFIPANNSSARVIQQLNEGDEQGVFCETEADSMGNVLKQDWGSYSDLLRKAFHHEPITYSRKQNKEWVEIKKPRLSVAISGTPCQVQNLINSAEDGLFSRFIFYTFKSDTVWIDANDTYNGVNLTKHFEQLSDVVCNLVNFLEQSEKIDFELSPEQWQKLNDFGKDSIAELTTFVSEDLASTSKRLGIILFRVAMIITVIRYFDNGESSSRFVCSDEDFELALALVKVYQEHAVFMFRKLPKQVSVSDKVLRAFFKALPDNFQRFEAILLGEKQFNIKHRKIDSYLSVLYNTKWLDKPKTGFFRKLK